MWGGPCALARARGGGLGRGVRGRGDLRGGPVRRATVADDAATRTHLRTRGSKVWLLPPGLVFSACGNTLDPSGGRVGLRLELAWLDRAETPC